MRLYEIYSVPTQEELDEGFKEKLAGLALSAALAFSATGAKADEVYAYLDSSGKMQTVATQSELPADAKMKFVVDTDTNKVTQLSQQSTSQGHTLYGQVKVGMSIDEVKNAVPAAKEVKRGSGELKWAGIDPKNIQLKDNDTYYEFNNGKLVGVHKIITMRKSEYKEFSPIFGHGADDFRSVFTEIYNIAKSRVGNATSKVTTSNGVSFGLGVGAITSNGIFMLGLDKTGTNAATVQTTNGSVTMISLTQSGVRNAFTPVKVIESYHQERPKSELEF